MSTEQEEKAAADFIAGKLPGAEVVKKAAYENVTEQEAAYLRETIRLQQNVLESMARLAEHWVYDADHSVDANDYLKKHYPFHMSFDDMVVAVQHWTEVSRKQMEEVIH